MAKGRVERLWRILQDRLCQELRLANITTLEGANAALPTLLARHNARFRQAPAEPGSAYRRPPAGKRPADVFCFRYWRTVSMDNVVSLDGRIIPSRPGRAGAHTPAPASRSGSTWTAALLCTAKDDAWLARAPVWGPPHQTPRQARRKARSFSTR